MLWHCSDAIQREDMLIFTLGVSFSVLRCCASFTVLRECKLWAWSTLLTWCLSPEYVSLLPAAASLVQGSRAGRFQRL